MLCHICAEVPHVFLLYQVMPTVAAVFVHMYRTYAIFSGDFHLGPREVIHHYVVTENRDINSGHRQAGTNKSFM